MMDMQTALATVERLHARISARRGGQQELEAYYRGEQPLKYATEAWQKMHAHRYAGFSDNWVASVANAEAERIKHTGLRLPRDPANDEIARLMHNWWQANDGDLQQSQGFLTTLITARSYVLVWYDHKRDIPTMQWEHPDCCEVETSPANPRERTAGLKTWVDGDTEYAILYTPTELWKFRRDRRQLHAPGASQATANRPRPNEASTGWEPYAPDNETWPLTNPLGVVPLVEIPNRPMLSGDPLSEVAGTRAMQDACNLMWAYLFVAADHASMPARVILNGERPMQPVLDKNGDIAGYEPVDLEELAITRMMTIRQGENSDGKGASIGEWSAAKLDVFTDVIESAIGHICAQTRTPPTYLISNTGMSNVSSEGLKASEIGLVKKVGEFQMFAGPALREVYRLMALADGRDDVAAAVSTATVGWADAEIRSQAQLTDALIKKRNMGYPLEYLMELDGLEPDQVQRVIAMIDQERARGMSTIGKAALELEGFDDFDSVAAPAAQ